MRRLLTCVALAAAVVVVTGAGPAAAKEVPASVRACGPRACVTVTDRVVRVAVAHALERGAGGPAAFGPFLRVTLRPPLFDASGYLVPSQGVVQLNGIDHRLGGRAAAILGERVSGVAPYRPRIAAVWVAGRRRPGLAATFVAVLRRPAIPMPAAVWHSRFVLVALDIPGDTPWTGWGSSLYFPALHVLHMPGGAWMRLTARQAAVVAAATAPPVRTGAGGSALPAALVAAAAGLALAAGGIGIRGMRRPQASRS